MSHAMSRADVTFSAETIHNPAEPRHFMRIKPLARRQRIRIGGELLAETAHALRVLEVGKDVYDPVVYVPAGDVIAPLRRNQRSTHCPLKGDASYFDLMDDDGALRLESFAWSYEKPFDFAGALAGYVAFVADNVTFEDAPA